MLVLQFRRHPGSRVFVFDTGRSIRATVLGLDGEHYDLGGDGAIAFQPLAGIDDAATRSWAAEWLVGRLVYEGIESDTGIKEDRKSTSLISSHKCAARMQSSAGKKKQATNNTT